MLALSLSLSLINDVNKETTRIRQLVADKMTGDWGFYLKRVGGGESVALGASNTFEPASMIKIVHAVTAMRQIQISPTVDVNTDVTWYANPDFPARYPGDTGYRENIGEDPQHADVCAYDGDTGDLLTGSTYVDDLGPVIVAQTLQQSDNRTTDALTLRYGFGGLFATKTLAGMTDSQINHRIGCPGNASPQPLAHNRLTLRDAGKIYEGVQGLTLLNSQHRALLYTYMSGGPIGSGDLRTMVYQEAAAAGLSIADRNLFVSHVETRSKGGSTATARTSTAPARVTRPRCRAGPSAASSGCPSRWWADGSLTRRTSMAGTSTRSSSAPSTR